MRNHFSIKDLRIFIVNELQILEGGGGQKLRSVEAQKAKATYFSIGFSGGNPVIIRDPRL